MSTLVCPLCSKARYCDNWTDYYYLLWVFSVSSGCYLCLMILPELFPKTTVSLVISKLNRFVKFALDVNLLCLLHTVCTMYCLFYSIVFFLALYKINHCTVLHKQEIIQDLNQLTSNRL